MTTTRHVCLLMLLLWGIVSSSFAQTPQQLQAADAELNQVYQQLRGTLNDAQKQELKTAQKDWLNKRDAFVAANPGNPQGALYQATVQRVKELRNSIAPSGKEGTANNIKPSTNSALQKIQTADKEMNRVYHELQEQLDATQKEQLTVAQREWLKMREAFVLSNPDNHEGLCQATWRRTMGLKDALVSAGKANAVKNARLTTDLSKEELQMADNKLNEVYKEAMKMSDDTQKEQLQNDQRQWLVQRQAMVVDWPNDKYLSMRFATEKRVQDLKISVNSLLCQKDPFLNLKNKALIGEHDAALNNLQTLSYNLAERLDTANRKKLYLRYLAFRRKLQKVTIQPPQPPYDWFFVDDEVIERRIQLIREQSQEIEEQIKIAESKPALREARVQVPKYSFPFLDTLPKYDSERLEVVYQSLDWDNHLLDYDLRGNKYRLSVVGNVVNVFDITTRLLLGSFEVNVGGFAFEDAPPSYFRFLCNENFVYCEKSSHKSRHARLYSLPLFKTILGWGEYRGGVAGPIVDAGGNIGFFKASMPQANRYDSLKTLLNTCEFKFTPLGFLPKDTGDGLPLAEEDLQFVSSNPVFLQKIGFFEELGNQQELGRSLPVKDPVDASEGEEFPIFAYKDLNLAQASPDDWRNGVVAVQLFDHFVVLHENRCGQLSSSILDFNSLNMTRSEWSGPIISAMPIPKYSSFTGRMAMLGINSPPDPRMRYASLDSSNGEILFKKDYGNKAYKYTANIQKLDISLLLPPENTEGDYDGGTYGTSPNQVYCYSDAIGKTGVLAGYWQIGSKVSQFQYMGIFSLPLHKWIHVSSISRDTRNHDMQPPSHFFDRENDTIWISVPSITDLQGSGKSASRTYAYVKRGNSLNAISIKSGQTTVSYKNITDFECFAVSDKWVFGLPKMEEPYAELWSRNPLQRILVFSWNANGKVSAFDDSGNYASTGTALKSIAIKKQGHALPFEQFDLSLNRPDIVLHRLGAPPEAIAIAKELRENRMKRMGVTEDMLRPDFHLPDIQFAKELPLSTDSRDLSLEIKASDTKYPLERLRVYVNDVPVNGKDGESLRSLNTRSLDRTIPVNLSAGKNKIQVSVLNSAGAESLYATAEVNCTAPAEKPNLYVVAMGVSDYANSQFNLKYAAKDAEDLAAKLKARAENAYGEVKELLLKDGEVTIDSLAKVREFLKPATVDDSVVLFMAGHGLLDDKYDYYFGTSDMDFNNPAVRGIAFDDMDDILAELPSRKKSLLMDTCHAGELDADEKKVLAAADAAASGAPVQLVSNKSVAVRSVGTRGMAVKGIEGAKGKSEWYERISGMFVDLRRGSGSTILSSSAGAEYAFESGEQKNGLFTYAVLEALDGKNDADTDKDGKVTMKELCESVKKRVQDLSGGKQTPNTRRLNLESDFPLATAGPLEPGMSQQKSSGFIR